MRSPSVARAAALSSPVIMKIMLKAKTVQTFSTITYAEHAEILETIERRDRTAYQYKMKSHLDAGFRHFESAKPTE